MKIDNNHDLRIPPAVTHRGPVKYNEAGHSSVSVQRPSRPETDMRELGNALMVMQKAQMLVQEALSVSSRLQNIAAEGVNSGSIDYSEINKELAQLSSTFEELSPSMKTQVGLVTEDVKNANDALDRGDLKTMDSALQHGSKLIDEASAQYIRTMGADSLSGGETQRLAAAGLPENAISLQGNISPDRVKRLVG